MWYHIHFSTSHHDITCDIMVCSYMISQYDITLWCHMWCHILGVGSSSRPAVSGCRRCNLLVVGRGLKHEPQVNTSPLAAAAACVGGVGCIRSCGGGLAFGNWPAGSQHQPPKLLHSRRQPAWNTSASGPEKSDHAQKRFCPLADRPNQRHPKNRISFQWNCPMKNFNWFQVFNLGRTWRWLCRLWCDEVPRKLDRQRHPKNRISVQKVNNNEAFIISIARIKIGGRIQCLVKKSKWPILRKNQNGLASS